MLPRVEVGLWICPLCCDGIGGGGEEDGSRATDFIGVFFPSFVGGRISQVRLGSILLCCFVSGERRHGCGEDGVPSSFIDGGFPVSTADDSMRLYVQPCEREEILCIPGDASFVCVVVMGSGAGRRFRCSSTVLAAVVNFSPSSLCLPVADFLSMFMMRAGGSSRRWLMRQIQSLESAAEGKDGAASASVPVSGRNSRGRWGCWF